MANYTKLPADTEFWLRAAEAAERRGDPKTADLYLRTAIAVTTDLYLRTAIQVEEKGYRRNPDVAGYRVLLDQYDPSADAVERQDVRCMTTDECFDAIGRARQAMRSGTITFQAKSPEKGWVSLVELKRSTRTGEWRRRFV